MRISGDLKGRKPVAGLLQPHFHIKKRDLSFLAKVRGSKFRALGRGERNYTSKESDGCRN